jgi:hypothetical protein
MTFNVTFNNISVISWRSVLLVEETRENHRPVASHWQTLSHNVVLSTPRLSGIRTHNMRVYDIASTENVYCTPLKNSGLSWPCSYGSWIYNYLCSQCLSPLTMWIRTPLWRGVLDTTLRDKVCQWLAVGRCIRQVTS